MVRGLGAFAASLVLCGAAWADVGSGCADLSFSDAAALGQPYAQHLELTEIAGAGRILLADPPAPDATCRELLKIAALADRRPWHAEDIACERALNCMRLGTFSLGKSAESHPRTHLLIRMVNTAVLPTLFRLKLHFDRARPDHVDPTLMTEIEAPAHPAYPSGHAAQAMLFAIVLSEVNPAAADAHFRDARRIAFNREVAGVHYPSDTVAGFELALKFSALLANEPWYRMLVQHAAAEWP